jgi:hypothetical protein
MSGVVAQARRVVSRFRQGTSETTPIVDKTDHPTVVEYGVQQMIKRGQDPLRAARETNKKLSGGTNLFLGNGIVAIDERRLAELLWQRLVDRVVESLAGIREGKENYALDGVVQHFRQSSKTRKELAKRVVRHLGRDPFPSGSV